MKKEPNGPRIKDKKVNRKGDTVKKERTEREKSEGELIF